MRRLGKEGWGEEGETGYLRGNRVGSVFAVSAFAGGDVHHIARLEVKLRNGLGLGGQELAQHEQILLGRGDPLSLKDSLLESRNGVQGSHDHMEESLIEQLDTHGK
jgi:hypothetical protein